MEFGWNQEFIDFREEVRAFIEEWRTPELLRENWAAESGRGPCVKRFHEALNQRGWMRMCWPVAYGGEGKSPLYRFILIEEMEYWDMPYGDVTFTSIAPTLLEYGSEAQKQKHLPAIWRGDAYFALGYSEPNAGTDLASLRTRAERRDDGWLINGQKTWTSEAEIATHIWLAARTDPGLPKHKGISIFIVPAEADGVTIRPLRTLSGTRTNQTFYDDVFVEDGALVGEVNQGWSIIMNALSLERVGLVPHGNVARTFDLLLEHLREQRPELLRDPCVRRSLAELKLDLHRNRALVTKNAWIISKGETPWGEASMVKVWGSELRYRMANLAMDLLGRSGALTSDSGDRAPAAGRMEHTYRLSPIFRFGGGTNEIQRDIIATRGLGLPRL